MSKQSENTLAKYPVLDRNMSIRQRRIFRKAQKHAMTYAPGGQILLEHVVQAVMGCVGKGSYGRHPAQIMENAKNLFSVSPMMLFPSLAIGAIRFFHRDAHWKTLHVDVAETATIHFGCNAAAILYLIGKSDPLLFHGVNGETLSIRVDADRRVLIVFEVELSEEVAS